MGIGTDTFDRIERIHGMDIQFSRGEESCAPLRGLFSVKNYTLRDAAGVQLVHTSHDVALRADQLNLNDERIQPRRGDIVTRIQCGRRQVFEVQFPDTTQPPFRWSDPAGEILRVHTSLILDEVLT